MKAINFVLVLMLILVMGACTTTVKFPVSQIAPAADGKVVIKKDKNHNYLIGVKIKYLAAAERLNPPREHYVVWITSNDGKTTNIGMLKSGKKNYASLQGLTPLKPQQIFITAEDESDASWPGTQELFRIDNLDLK